MLGGIDYLAETLYIENNGKVDALGTKTRQRFIWSALDAAMIRRIWSWSAAFVLSVDAVEISAAIAQVTIVSAPYREQIRHMERVSK